MKKGLLIFLLFFSIFSFSQITIKGKLISNNNKPLEAASVYFNNTTIGTITNKKGEFSLKIKEGNYTLVASFLGYKTFQTSINTSLIKDFHTIKLQEDDTVLDEVVLKKTIYNEDWKYNLTRFKQAFLGKTKLAEECEILNSKSIHFDYNYKTHKLTAFAKEPLKIKHKGLGYLITYDLIDFELKNRELFFSGYAQYKNLRKSIRKKWKKNRQIAYNGSRMHFLRSLLNKQLKKDGFVVNQFKRVPNPNRPSEKRIKLARELFKLNNGRLNLLKEIENPKTIMDSVVNTLVKSRLPKHRDYLYKQGVNYENMISFDKNIPLLNFKDYLMIVYKNEVEEENYLKGMFGKRKKASGVQTSNIVLLNGKVIIDNSGVLAKPNAIFNEGYWGFEAFANMLPLDYQLPKK